MSNMYPLLTALLLSDAGDDITHSSHRDTEKLKHMHAVTAGKSDQEPCVYTEISVCAVRDVISEVRMNITTMQNILGWVFPLSWLSSSPLLHYV